MATDTRDKHDKRWREMNELVLVIITYTNLGRGQSRVSTVLEMIKTAPQLKTYTGWQVGPPIIVPTSDLPPNFV